MTHIRTNLTKRIIPCLDVKEGRTVKGVNFLQLRDMGDPVELARRYSEEGADELVLLDISATDEGRGAMIEVVKDVARSIAIPFTVGGGINTLSQIEVLLENGADKVSLNSAAVRRPALIEEAAIRFGSQCIVLAVDTKNIAGKEIVYVRGGKEQTDKALLLWIEEGYARGAGEILLTPMDRDGTKEGYDCAVLRQVSECVSLPLIASGGAGNFGHVAEVSHEGLVDAALAASIFHQEKGSVRALKQFLQNEGIEVRNEYDT